VRRRFAAPHHFSVRFGLTAGAAGGGVAAGAAGGGCVAAGAGV